VYINAVCVSDYNCSYVLFADDFKVFHIVNGAEDCTHLQFHLELGQRHEQIVDKNYVFIFYSQNKPYTLHF
jgi:hypothetical protein